MNWHVVHSPSQDPAYNIALDHALYEHAALHTGLPLIHFYHWSSPAVSIGAYQDTAAIHLANCQAKNVQPLRRMTGGKFIQHAPCDLSFCAIVPIREFNFSVQTLKRALANGVLIGLRTCKVRATHGKDTIVRDNAPLLSYGSKALEQGFYMYQATVHIDPRDEQLTTRDAQPVACAKNHLRCSVEKLHTAIINGLLKDKEYQEITIPDRVHKRATHLHQSKYQHVRTSSVSPEVMEEIA